MYGTYSSRESKMMEIFGSIWQEHYTNESLFWIV